MLYLVQKICIISVYATVFLYSSLFANNDDTNYPNSNILAEVANANMITNKKNIAKNKNYSNKVHYDVQKFLQNMTNGLYSIIGDNTKDTDKIYKSNHDLEDFLVLISKIKSLFVSSKMSAKFKDRLKEKISKFNVSHADIFRISHNNDIEIDNVTILIIAKKVSHFIKRGHAKNIIIGHGEDANYLFSIIENIIDDMIINRIYLKTHDPYDNVQYNGKNNKTAIIDYVKNRITKYTSNDKIDLIFKYIKSTNQKYSDDDLTNLSNNFINYLVQSELSQNEIKTYKQFDIHINQPFVNELLKKWIDAFYDDCKTL